MSDIYVKYPRTPHLPNSYGVQNDDIRLETFESFKGNEVIITEKMDGENTTMYTDHIHARSINSPHHPSRDWVKQFHSMICNNIPYGWRICGENMYALHSIPYYELESYFLAFAVFDDNNYCLSWEDTVYVLNELGICHVPILYDGLFSIDEVNKIISKIDTDKTEGFVIRNKHSFHYNEFGKNVGKWVRNNHVQSSEHWKKKPIVPNGLKV